MLNKVLCDRDQPFITNLNRVNRIAAVAMKVQWGEKCAEHTLAISAPLTTIVPGASASSILVGYKN